MSETSPALPNAWIQQLLKRFRSIYGNRVEVVYGTADEDDFVATWRSELGRYDGADIKVALTQLRGVHPDYPPTLYQFADLCRDAMRHRTGTTPRLDAPPIDGPIDPVVEGAIAKALENRPHPRKWAERILERAAAGLDPRPPMIAVNAAKEALGL